MLVGRLLKPRLLQNTSYTGNNHVDVFCPRVESLGATRIQEEPLTT